MVALLVALTLFCLADALVIYIVFDSLPEYLPRPLYHAFALLATIGLLIATKFSLPFNSQFGSTVITPLAVWAIAYVMYTWFKKQTMDIENRDLVSESNWNVIEEQRRNALVHRYETLMRAEVASHNYDEMQKHFEMHERGECEHGNGNATEEETQVMKAVLGYKKPN